jgi:hypothetical protein
VGFRVGDLVGALELVVRAWLEVMLKHSRSDLLIQKLLINSLPAVGFRLGDFVGTVHRQSIPIVRYHN